MNNKTEVVIFDNGVIAFNEEQRFWFGMGKARAIREGAILKMVEQARKVMLR